MRHALFLPLFGELADPRVAAGLAADAEAAGWDGLFVWDHITYRAPVTDVADPWVVLAAMACATERVLLGPLVTPLPRRRPTKLARETVGVDRLSGGRLVFGAGLGGDNNGEFAELGDEGDPRARARLLDEGLDLLLALWSGEPVAHRGAAYTVDGPAFRPTPVQRPRIPVWLAARYPNRAPVRRAARYDGLFPIDLDRPDQLREMLALVAEHRPADATGPFDVPVGAPAGAGPDDIAAWEEAGATWWLAGFDQFTVSAAQVRSVIADGPQA
jgi:alkanesulfonate monooxygenase SsuD/methylene tetrahydromethanopterin reductase-like flavin-dependent oxidoreductase (luciferase family)